MKAILLAGAMIVAATAASAQDAPDLNLDQKTLLRCSAAFALAANMQENGDTSLGEIPDLRARGQEYFVRAMAQLMDEKSLGREQISALLRAEVVALTEGDTLAKALPTCMASLEASGL